MEQIDWAVWYQAGARAFGQVQWADWLQAAAGIIALLLAPQSFKAAWSTFRYRFAASCRADAPMVGAGSKRWTVTIQNRSAIMRVFNGTIYTDRPGNRIGFARVVTENDGGFHVDRAKPVHGALMIAVDRFAPQREFEVELVFEGPDQPSISMESGSVRREIVVREPTGAVLPGNHLLVAHTRLMMLILNIVSFYAVVIVRILWIAVVG